MTGYALGLWTLASMALGAALAIYGGCAWVIYDEEREMYDTRPLAALKMALQWPLDWVDGRRDLTGREVGR